jgi:hypothetical protein
MQQRKIRATTLTLVTIVLALASLSFKCSGVGCADTDPRCNYAKAADDIAGGISAMIDAKQSLAKKGRITMDEDRKLTQLLTVANEAAIAFNNRLKATTVLDAASKTDLLNLLSNVTTAVDDLNNSGVLRIGNADAKQKLTRVFGTISSAVNILIRLRAASPPPTPRTTPTI